MADDPLQQGQGYFLRSAAGQLHREASMRQPLPMLCGISADIEGEGFCP